MLEQEKNKERELLQEIYKLLKAHVEQNQPQVPSNAQRQLDLLKTFHSFIISFKTPEGQEFKKELCNYMCGVIYEGLIRYRDKKENEIFIKNMMQ